MKICPKCATSNLDLIMKCPKCGEDISTVEKVKWNDTKRIRQLTNAAKVGIDAPEKVYSKKEQLNVKMKQMNEEGIAYCPKCGSTSLSGNKKGFGIGKAVVGAAIAANPLGLIAGNINAKKVRVTCLKCGHNFWSGKK